MYVLLESWQYIYRHGLSQPHTQRDSWSFIMFAHTLRLHLSASIEWFHMDTHTHTGALAVLKTCLNRHWSCRRALYDIVMYGGRKGQCQNCFNAFSCGLFIYYPQAVQLKFKLHDVMVKTKECSDASGEVSTLAADPFWLDCSPQGGL